MRQKQGLWAGPHLGSQSICNVGFGFPTLIVLNVETQQSDLSYEFLYSHCYYSVALSLPLLLVSYATLLQVVFIAKN